MLLSLHHFREPHSLMRARVFPNLRWLRKIMFGKSLDEHRGITLVLIGFFILGAVYSTIVPIFETPDEIQHYFHVKHIADGKGLPVLEPESEQLFDQEGGQPSLYYLLGALTTFWIDTDDAEELLNYNPFVNVGIPGRHGNKNIILHGDYESFPYRGTTLALHLLRYVSVLFGALTVFTTYLLALEVLPGRSVVALGAAAITAFNPQFVFTHAAVNNDGLLTSLCSLALLLSVYLVTRGPSLRRYVGLGVVLGLAALTKLTGVGLLVVVAGALLIVARRHSLVEAIKGGAIVLGLVVLLSGWWYARNWLLYGDPTGMNVFFQLLGGPPGRNLTAVKFIRELEGFRLSYWAVFGWFNVLASSWVYRFFDLLILLGALGLPLALVRSIKKPQAVSYASLALLLVWIAVIGLGYVKYNQMAEAATGRLVFPAIACFSILLSWGLIQLPPRKWAGALVALLGVTMFVIAMMVPFLYIAPAYASPAHLSPQQVESIPNRQDVRYGDQMKLLGYELEGSVFRPGELVYVTLYWQGVTAMERDYSVSLVVLTPSGDLLGQEDSYPGLGSAPTSAWKPGQVIADRTWVRIRRRAATPTIGWLGVSVYYLPTMEHLAPSRPGKPVDEVFLEPVEVVSWEPEEYQVTESTNVNFGNEIDLLGYDLGDARAQPGDTVEVTLYWRARQEMSRDYTVFAHLVDDEGEIWTQNDDQPLGGDYPTSFWDPGQELRDRYELALPSDLPAGEYQVEVGFYLASTGERVPVLDHAGEMLDNRVLLGPIEVSE